MKSFRNVLRALRHKDDGVVTVEAMLVVPMIVSAIMASYTFFDLYKAKALELKANYAVADAISRETRSINPRFFDNLYNLHRMVGVAEKGTAVRLSIVDWNPDKTAYTVRWTKAKSTLEKPLPALDKTRLAELVPKLADFESVILVESYKEHSPFRRIGLSSAVYEATSVTRPRFAPQVCWTENADPKSSVKTC